MLQYLDNYNGSLRIDGKDYPNIAAAISALSDYEGPLVIELNVSKSIADPVIEAPMVSADPSAIPIYQIKVRQYMTKPPSVDFDFHDKWNGGVPMPMRVMVGKKIQETKGLVKMELWGEITETITPICMKCGRVLTNKVSQYFGIGPECGGHNYTNPFSTDDELNAAVAQTKEQLSEIRWTGWIFKSAIEEQKVVRNEYPEI